MTNEPTLESQQKEITDLEILIRRTQFYLDTLARNSSVDRDVPLGVVTVAGRIVALAWPDYQAASESPVEFPSYATPEFIEEMRLKIIKEAKP